MERLKADLVVVDKSYPVFSELFRHDDWKIVYNDNRASALFVPVEAREKRIELMENIPEQNNDLSAEIVEIL